MPSDQEAIAAIVTRINEAWQDLAGDALADALAECFAGDVVMRGPSLALLGTGRDFASQSYEDFVAETEIKNFLQDDPEIDIVGDTAVAYYQWKMTYVLADNEYTEQGRDLFVLARRSGRWWVVWRALFPS
jgi:ketosteroid isomerase-like protein